MRRKECGTIQILQQGLNLCADNMCRNLILILSVSFIAIDYLKHIYYFFSAIKDIELSNESKNVVLFIGNGQEINNGEEDGETDILNSIYQLSKIKSRVRIQVFVSDESVRDTFVKYGVNCELHT